MAEVACRRNSESCNGKITLLEGQSARGIWPVVMLTTWCLMLPAAGCAEQGKAQPQQLLRVGSTLYRRALSFSAGSPKGTMSVIRRLDGDGTAQLGELMGAAAMEEVRSGGAIVVRGSC